MRGCRAYIGGMIRIAALVLAASLLAAPARAEESVDGDVSEGIDLLGEGARLLFRGLTDEMEPALRRLAEGMEPTMRELMGLIEDFDAYHPPERLPNGDIIIRRKTPLAPPAAEGDIEI